MQSTTELSTVDALARLAEQRDPQAWAAIVDQHGPNILRLAQRITACEALCEDVCQEALLQIREHAGNFCPPRPPDDPEAAARGWIMRIVCRTAFKMQRSRRRSNQREAKAASSLVSAQSAAEAALFREQAELIRREAAELPEILREPLALRFHGELSYRELGTALGCSETAAKRRVQRGLDVLRSRLAARGVTFAAGALIAILSQSGAQAAEAATMSAPSGAVQALDIQRRAAWHALLKSSSAPALQGLVNFGGLTVMARIVFGAIVVLFALSAYQAVSIHELQHESAQANANAQQMAHIARDLERNLEARTTEIVELQDELTFQRKDSFELRNQVAELKKSGTAASARGQDSSDEVLVAELTWTIVDTPTAPDAKKRPAPAKKPPVQPAEYF